MAANVSPVMAVNLDPKPGRWILPLVILGMIAFTYFFVRELPEATPDTTLAVSPTTTTTTSGTTVTTPPGGGTNPDPALQDYLEELDTINGELQLLKTEMITVNQQFDDDEIEYSEIEQRVVVVADDTQALADRLGNLTAPEALQLNHDALRTAIDSAAFAANDALAGLRSTDTGEQRRNALAAYVQAVDDFDVEVGNAKETAQPEA